MKKFLLFGTALCVATSVWAFGGIGIGSKSSSHKAGVDAIGIHIDPNGKKADIDIVDPCPNGLERNTDGTCTICANGNVYLSYMDDPCGTEIPMNKKCADVETHDWYSVEACRGWDGCEICYDNETDYCYPTYVTPTARICQNEASPCKSNNDCGDGEFCNLVSVSGNYEKPNAGACAPLGKSEVVTYQDVTLLRSENRFTWWGADNWCRAQGKLLATFADLNIDKSNLGNAFMTNHFCTQSNDEHACEGVVWSNLHEVFGDDDWIFWLNDSYEQKYGCLIQPYGLACGGTDSAARSGSWDNEKPALCR